MISSPIYKTYHLHNFKGNHTGSKFRVHVCPPRLHRDRRGSMVIWWTINR